MVLVWWIGIDWRWREDVMDVIGGGGGGDMIPLGIIQIPTQKWLDNGQETVRKGCYLEN